MSRRPASSPAARATTSVSAAKVAELRWEEELGEKAKEEYAERKAKKEASLNMLKIYVQEYRDEFHRGLAEGTSSRGREKMDSR